MKHTILIIFNMIFLLSGLAQEVEHDAYDSILANKLNADEYGMKTYYFVYLKAGKNRTQDSLTAQKIQRAHLDNIIRLEKEHKLIIAGPFLDEGEVRGVFIFNVSSMEEAEQLTKSDPAVQAGRLIMEIHPWYGPAALILIPELHKKLAKKDI